MTGIGIVYQHEYHNISNKIYLHFHFIWSYSQIGLLDPEHHTYITNTQTFRCVYIYINLYHNIIDIYIHANGHARISFTLRHNETAIELPSHCTRNTVFYYYEIRDQRMYPTLVLARSKFESVFSKNAFFDVLKQT